MKVLISYFEAFGGDNINAVELIAKALPINEEIDLVKLPVTSECVEKLWNKVNKSYDAIISLGQAYGYDKIAIERVAINLDDFRIQSNDGKMIVDQKIVEDGANAYFASLPTRKIYERLNDKYSIKLSYSAGTYLCNHLFYGISHLLNQKQWNILYGFIHFPILPMQKHKESDASMELEISVNALLEIIEVIRDEICN